MVTELSESVVETICLAARKLTGFARRQFQAEMAVKYCEGHRGVRKTCSVGAERP